MPGGVSAAHVDLTACFSSVERRGDEDSPHHRPFVSSGGSSHRRCSGACCTDLLWQVSHKVGTSGADLITGTDGPDVIVSLAGGDTIRGLGGADRICGGPGDDHIYGQKGSDQIDGARGYDRLCGGAGTTDNLIDDIGTDTVYGYGGSDRIEIHDGAPVDFADAGSGIDSASWMPPTRS